MQIKFFKKEKKFEKEKESLWLNINFYWKLAVNFMFVFFLLSFFFGYYLFRQINREPVLLESSVSPQAETIKKERIDKALKYFFLRAEKSNQILNFPAPVIDPSL